MKLWPYSFFKLQKSSTQLEWDEENQKEVQGLNERLLRLWIHSLIVLSATMNGKFDQILEYTCT